jgi:hypothetical protein
LYPFIRKTTTSHDSHFYLHDLPRRHLRRPKIIYAENAGCVNPCLELVQDSLAESKTAHFSPFFTFFQLRSSGYAPSKMQKPTKNQPVFANGRKA